MTLLENLLGGFRFRLLTEDLSGKDSLYFHSGVNVFHAGLKETVPVKETVSGDQYPVSHPHPETVTPSTGDQSPLISVVPSKNRVRCQNLHVNRGRRTVKIVDSSPSIRRFSPLMAVNASRAGR